MNLDFISKLVKEREGVQNIEVTANHIVAENIEPKVGIYYYGKVTCNNEVDLRWADGNGLIELPINCSNDIFTQGFSTVGNFQFIGYKIYV